MFFFLKTICKPANISLPLRRALEINIDKKYLILEILMQVTIMTLYTIHINFIVLLGVYRELKFKVN